MPRDDRVHVRPRERWIASEHLVHDAPQSIDVASAVHVPHATGLLGTHVERRADGDARLGEPGATRCRRGPSDPEVRNHRLIVMQQYVLGLDVAMDDLERVRVAQG